MSRTFTQEIFFRPETLVHRETTTVSAEVHNNIRLLLCRHDEPNLFVPIRSLQYLALLAPEEILFIDSQGPYVYRDGKGGRAISLCWRLLEHARESLTTPVSYEISYYIKNGKDVQRRLLSDLPAVLQRQRDRQSLISRLSSASGCRVLPFRDRNGSSPATVSSFGEAPSDGQHSRT